MADTEAAVVAVPPQAKQLTAVMREIEECVNIISQHEGFQDITTLAPLGLGEGGASAAFSISNLQQALCGGGDADVGVREYVATGNFGWIDYKYTNSAGVPMLRNSIVSYAETKFSDARNLPIMRVTVAVTSAQPLPATMFPPGGSAPAVGSIMAMTPQEEIVAPWLMLGSLLKKGPLAESDVQAWRRFFSTVLFTWKLLPLPEDLEFETISIRQEAAMLYQTISYTPIQWVCKVIQMKKEREATGNKVTSADLATIFKKRGFKPARGQEHISSTFIDNALYIHNHALCYPEVGPCQPPREKWRGVAFIDYDLVLSMRTAYCAYDAT